MIPTIRQSCCESHESLDFAPSYMTATTSSTRNDNGEVLSLPEAAIEDQTQGDIQTQVSSPLFRLSPELRNIIYKYAFDGRDDECGWDEEHNCPKINLINASRNAPSNELLRSCRRINSECRALFVKAQRMFWSSTTFTLAFKKEVYSIFEPVAFPNHLPNNQIRSIARIIVDIVVDQETTLTATLTPNLRRNSWNVRRAANYPSDYSEELDKLHWTIPSTQPCHTECLPLFAYAQVNVKLCDMFPPASRAPGKCVVCGDGLVQRCRVIGDRTLWLLLLGFVICSK